MKRKLIFLIPLVFMCYLIFSAKAFAISNSDIKINVTSSINGLQNESGVVAVEQFPAEILINVTTQIGILTDIKLKYGGKSWDITPECKFTVENKEACGPYTITARTDQGAVLTITVNVVFQVEAIYNTRYRTIVMNVKEIYEGETLIRIFPEPERIELVNANTVADYEQERISTWIGRYDGGTYTLKGSLVVEIYEYESGRLYGTYDTQTDFESLTTLYNWTKKAFVAFETMRNTAFSYQSPVRIDIDAVWCDEKKQEVYGKIIAQDKGVSGLIYPYQTTSVTFTKDDIPLSRNFIYMGLEWDYIPETNKYTDGESKTQTAVKQKIHYKIPTVDFYFKFKAQKGNDLSVVINAPATVYRGDSYSFTVIYMNSGKSAAYDVPLIGTMDGAMIKEIPDLQDFSPDESKTYTIKRKASTSFDAIKLWANIGIPAGFYDGNLDNNTAEVVIKVIDPEQKSTPEPDNDPDQPDNLDDPRNPENEPPEPPELCDLSSNIFAPSIIYEQEDYSFIVNFTNRSDVELFYVPLLGKSNDNTLLQIPQTVSFKPHETKSFTVTGTAGTAGDIYQLWANVGVPDGFTDEDLVNNTAVSSITVVERLHDDPDSPMDDPENPDNPENPSEPDNPDNPDEPNNPDNPDEPGNPPDSPLKLLCDVWANLSSPPVVFEQEEYSFTVYFASSTDKALSGVSLNVFINGKRVSDIPATVNFKPFEKKFFEITSTAGVKGESLRITAKVSPPNGYVDIYPGNNQASTEVMVLARPYDLDVQRITPDQYKENQSVITTIKVSNKGSQDFTPGQNVTVLFQVPELSLSKRMDAVVMEKETWNVVSVIWNTPNVHSDKKITLIAIINPEGTLNNESTFNNNTYTQKAVVQDTSYEEPEESHALPAPPPRNEQPRITWWEQRYEGGQFVWREFYAELMVSAELDYATKTNGYLKSGYGYSIKVTAAIDTNYDRPKLITTPQTAELYLPEYRYETAIPLVKEGGQYIFKENPESPFRYRVQYIPLWFPDDKDYIAQLLVTDVHTPGGTLSRWTTGGELKVHVMDNMYSDDVTTSN